MFDISSVEFLVVAAVMLIVVKPEDIPAVMKSLGRFIKKINRISRDFYACLEAAAGEDKDDNQENQDNNDRTI